MLTRLSQLKARTLLRLLALLSGMMWSATVLLGQTYTDPNLPNANWTEIRIPPSNASTSFAVTALPTARQTVHTLAGSPPPEIVVAHVFGPTNPPFIFSIDPSTGTIASLVFSYDLLQIQPPPNQCVGYAPLVLQANTYYTTPSDSICQQSIFTTFQHTLDQKAFTKLSGPGPAKPDLSCAGSPFQIGFISSNSSPNVGSAYTRTSQIKNWSVTINKAAPPPIDPKFSLTFTVSSGSTYTLQASLTVPRSDTNYGWYVNQVNKTTGAIITKLDNPSLWWTHTTTFPGWPPVGVNPGTTNPGVFQAGQYYRIVLGEWLTACPKTWTQVSTIICEGNGC
jgi:hypothetical protein